jgi:repressor LexA
MALTRRQKEVMDFLSGFIEKHGYSPSYEEIASGLGLASLATVHKHVQALEAKQYLRRSYNHSRSLEIGYRYSAEERARRPPAQAASIPLLGRIAAGLPVEAIANPESLEFSDFVGHENTFALQVRGDSMIEAGILDGDIALIKRMEVADTGDIVVALIDDEEATLKRFRRRGASIALEPANTTYELRILPPNRVRIQGKLVGLFRRY